MNMSVYVHEQVSALISRLAEETDRAANNTSEEGIHDLRVAIRRLSESLRVFRDLFPKGASKAVRRDLKTAMHLAGETRNHDIARDLMKKAGVREPAKFEAGRDRAAQELMSVIGGWRRDAVWNIWKEQLHA